MFLSAFFFSLKKASKYIRLRLVKRNIMIAVMLLTLLINLFLLFKGYETNKQRQKALKIENVSNVIYLLEQFGIAYPSLPGGEQQLLEITKTLTDYSKLLIDLSITPVFPVLDKSILKICHLDQHPLAVESLIIQKIIEELENYGLSKRKGVSLYMSCIGKWVNIEFPPETEFIFLGSSIGIQAIITVIFIWYILSIYNLHKPWARIKNSFGSLGIKTKSMVLPSFGPNIVRYIARLMDAIMDRVETLLKERTLTIAALSHDIRTPLAKLRLYAELSEDTSLQNKMLPHIDQIDAYLSIVLDYAKESYQSEKKCQIDMIALLGAAASDYIDIGCDVIMQLDPIKVILFGQPNNLQRALANLLDNAVKYGKRVCLTATYQHGVGLKITVSDEGPGLPEAELESVFQPFYRGANSQINQIVGSGLGLAIVRNIISYNNGQIYLKNRDEGGLQAVITFSDNLIFPPTPKNVGKS